MKNSIFIIIFALTAFKTIAQQTKDYKGHFISSKSMVESINIVNQATKYSFIKDYKGHLIGSKSVTYFQNTKTPYLNKVGFVKVNPIFQTCDILGSNGKKIGNIHNAYKGTACIIHCFTNNMDMKTHSKRKFKDKN